MLSPSLMSGSDVGHSLPVKTRDRLDSVKPMKAIKFVVKVTRVGSSAPEYVERIDRSPVKTTKNPKLALAMGGFTAEDIVDSLQHQSRCIPELVSVEVRV